MTRPKSERRCFGALLGRVFHVQFSLSKGMPFDITFLAFKLLFEKILHHFFAFIRTD